MRQIYGWEVHFVRGFDEDITWWGQRNLGADLALCFLGQHCQGKLERGPCTGPQKVLAIVCLVGTLRDCGWDLFVAGIAPILQFE